MTNYCYLGDTRAGMRSFIEAGHRVQTVITSPPYWGLRDYGVGGQLGLEPTPAEYIATMVAVFRDVRELMHDDGTLWLNMGDSYVSSGRGGGMGSLEGSRDAQDQTAKAGSYRRDKAEVGSVKHIAAPGLKPKDLVGMPWRLALALQDDGWYLRQDIIWHKPNPMPESVRDRCTKAHEYLFLLSKSERYYFDADAIKEKASPDTHARYARGRSQVHKYADGGPGHQTIAAGFEHMREPQDPGMLLKPIAGWATGSGEHTAMAHASPKFREVGEEHRTKSGLAAAERKFHGKVYPGNGVGFGHGYDEDVKPRVKSNESFHAAMREMPDDRNKRSVWTIPTEPFKGAHFATFPTALVEPCVLAGSRPGDIVFDCFMGSGTVGQVAASLGRQWLGCELNPAYHSMQPLRTAQAGLSL